MAITTFCTQINSFDGFTMIAGTYRELNYSIYNSASALIDFSGNDAFIWTLSPYDQLDYVALTKTGVLVDGNFVIYLLSTNTENLSGKYVQKAEINTGISSYNYFIGRGIINILPRGGIIYG